MFKQPQALLSHDTRPVQRGPSQGTAARAGLPPSPSDYRVFGTPVVDLATEFIDDRRWPLRTAFKG